ncbi:hypothetical protein OAR97_01140 [Arcobacteraceae bacterium]|nr:hypothetical protein [Arcobacteraceae bacterium]
MNKKIQAIIGFILALVGYLIQNDWGFILLTIGGYLFFSSFIDKGKPSK